MSKGSFKMYYGMGTPPTAWEPFWEMCEKCNIFWFYTFSHKGFEHTPSQRLSINVFMSLTPQMLVGGATVWSLHGGACVDPIYNTWTRIMLRDRSIWNHISMSDFAGSLWPRLTTCCPALVQKIKIIYNCLDENKRRIKTFRRRYNQLLPHVGFELHPLIVSL